MKRTSILIVFIFVGLLTGYGQGSNKEGIAGHSINFNGGLHLPAGDMADRFGMNGSVGFDYFFKTKSNWLIGLDYTYIFGRDLSDEGIFDMVRSSYNYFITQYGEIGEVAFYERGFYGGLKIGKIFPVFGPNKNSGIMVQAGAGLLQHRIHIHNDNEDLPYFADEYRDGWDQMTNGFAARGFVGYYHIDNRRLMNFYAGLEFIQGWTMNRRDWNFYLMGPDTRERKDIIYGLKFGWVFPIFPRDSEKYYLY